MRFRTVQYGSIRINYVDRRTLSWHPRRGGEGPTSMPTNRPAVRDGLQAVTDGGSSSVANAGLAAQIMTGGSSSSCIPSGGGNGPYGRNLELAVQSQSEVEATVVGSQPRIRVRAAHRMTLADESVRSISTIPPRSELFRSTALLREYAWIPRTDATRSSQ